MIKCKEGKGFGVIRTADGQIKSDFQAESIRSKGLHLDIIEMSGLPGVGDVHFFSFLHFVFPQGKESRTALIIQNIFSCRGVNVVTEAHLMLSTTDLVDRPVHE